MIFCRRQKTVLFLLLVLLCFSVPVQAQTKAEAGLLRLSRQKFIWLIAKDTTQLKAVLAPDLHYIHSNGWIESREDVLHDLSDGTLTYHAVTIAADTARITGSTGIVTGKAAFEVSLGESRIKLDLLYTEVYYRRGRRWLLAQRHACKI